MENRKTVILPVNSGSGFGDAFFTLKEFPTDRMIFLAWPDGVLKAESFALEAKKLGIASSIVRVAGKSPWEEFYKALVDVCEGIPRESILINISTADRISQCALTNAAHVNGLRAVAVIDGKLIMLPILKFSFSNLLSDKKMRILSALRESCINSMEEVAKSTGMSLQLVSYHINGTLKSKGLTELELVDTSEEKGRTRVCLSTMGRLFMDGYIKGEQS